MENSTKFYPNVEYNQKKRNKYFTLFAVFTVMMLLMDAWAVSEKLYWMLAVNAFWVLFIVLIPKTLKENPIKRDAVLEVNKTYVLKETSSPYGFAISENVEFNMFNKPELCMISPVSKLSNVQLLITKVP